MSITETSGAKSVISENEISSESTKGIIGTVASQSETPMPLEIQSLGNLSSGNSKELPDSTKLALHSSEELPDSTKLALHSSEELPDSTKLALHSSEELPDSTKVALHSSEELPGSNKCIAMQEEADADPKTTETVGQEVISETSDVEAGVKFDSNGIHTAGTKDSPTSPDENNDNSIFQWVQYLTVEEKKGLALQELCKIRESYPDLAPILWHSFGTMAALLQEIVKIYGELSPPALTPAASNRVCNSLALLQCIASHPDTKQFFLDAHIPLFLYPFLNTYTKSKSFEYLRLTTLGVIGALVKVDDPEVINFLLQTEIIPLCLRVMETGTELSKTVATFIVQKILLDDRGLSYICATYDRFTSVCRVLDTMVNSLVENPSNRLFKQIVRCYLRLADHPQAFPILVGSIPTCLVDNSLAESLSDKHAKAWLTDLLHALSISNKPTSTDEKQKDTNSIANDDTTGKTDSGNVTTGKNNSGGSDMDSYGREPTGLYMQNQVQGESSKVVYGGSEFVSKGIIGSDAETERTFGHGSMFGWGPIPANNTHKSNDSQIKVNHDPRFTGGKGGSLATIPSVSPPGCDGLGQFTSTTQMTIGSTAAISSLQCNFNQCASFVDGDSAALSDKDLAATTAASNSFSDNAATLGASQAASK